MGSSPFSCFLDFTLMMLLSYAFSYIFHRFKLLSLLFAIQEVFHGQKTIRRKLMKIFWTGFKLCLVFRCSFLRYSGNTHQMSYVNIMSYCVSQCYFVIGIDKQKDNVANQREHLILLLANVHIRQFPKLDQQPKVIICHLFHMK